MEHRVDFDINESLKLYLSDPSSIQTPEADSTIADCENDAESLTNAVINEALNPIIDSIANNPDAITVPSTFDTLQCLLKCASTCSLPAQTYIPDPNEPRSTSILPPIALSKILDLLVSGLSAETDLVNNDLETDDVEAHQHHKQTLELYAFLLQWTISATETKAAEKSAAAPVARPKGSKAGKPKAAAKDHWDSSAQIQVALDVMSKVMKLKLVKLFPTTSERDTFIGLFTRAVYLVLESESRVKIVAVRMHSFKVLCIAVKHHGHAYGKL